MASANLGTNEDPHERHRAGGYNLGIPTAHCTLPRATVDSDVEGHRSFERSPEFSSGRVSVVRLETVAGNEEDRC
jgi:hypothetical protein